MEEEKKATSTIPESLRNNALSFENDNPDTQADMEKKYRMAIEQDERVVS